MSLTNQLKDPTSPVAQWMSKRMSMEAGAKFVARQNQILAKQQRIVVEGADPVSVGRGFDYAFRWTRGLLYPDRLAAIKGAQKLEQRVIAREIIRMGNESPELRAKCSIILGWYEAVFRSGEIHPALKGIPYTTDLFIAVPEADARDVQLLTQAAEKDFAAIKGDWKPNPTFSGSEDVGGADGDWMIGYTLYECKTSRRREPFELSHLRQMVGYVLLDYHDMLKIREVAWYFPRQRTILRYPVSKVIKDVEEARASFRGAMQVSPKALQGPSALLRALEDIAFKHHGDELDYWDEDLYR